MTQAAETPADRLADPEIVRDQLAGKHVCPFCGALRADPNQPCPRCTMEDSPTTRTATRQRIGPWFVLQSRNPSAPGMRFQTLLSLVKKGHVTPRSVLRGPTTHQLWAFAARVKGLSREFGLCYHCGAAIEFKAVTCPKCDRPQEPPAFPDTLLETSDQARNEAARAERPKVEPVTVTGLATEGPRVEPVSKPPQAPQPHEPKPQPTKPQAANESERDQPLRRDPLDEPASLMNLMGNTPPARPRRTEKPTDVPAVSGTRVPIITPVPVPAATPIAPTPIAITPVTPVTPPPATPATTPSASAPIALVTPAPKPRAETDAGFFKLSSDSGNPDSGMDGGVSLDLQVDPVAPSALPARRPAPPLRPAPPPGHTKTEEGILSAKELAAAFQLDFRPDRKRRRLGKLATFVTLLLIAAVSAGVLFYLRPDYRGRSTAWVTAQWDAGRAYFSAAPATRPTTLPVRPSAPTTKAAAPVAPRPPIDRPAVIVPVPEVAPAVVTPDPKPPVVVTPPPAVRPEPAPVEPTAVKPQAVEPAPVDPVPIDPAAAVEQARTLRSQAIDAEFRREYPLALKLYQQIEKLPRAAWPPDLQVRLEEVRRKAK